MYWHLCNDKIRSDKFEIDKNNKDLVNNLMRLVEILSVDNSSERLTKAEIYRELGDFDNCLTTLKFKMDKQITLQHLDDVSEIKRLSQQQNSQVIILNNKK